MTAKLSYEEFTELLERNLGIVLKISRAYTSTRQDREDLVHDITFELWKSFPGFKGKSKLSTWIYRVALNTALNYRKRQDKRPIPLDAAIQFQKADNMQEENDPLISLLYDFISELDEFNRALILLYLDGCKHEEIAEITGLSKSNVGTRISRIKEDLRKKAVIKN